MLSKFKRIFEKNRGSESYFLLSDMKGGRNEVTDEPTEDKVTTYQDVLPDLKSISTSYLLNADENTPDLLPDFVTTNNPVDPDLLDISYPSHDVRHQDKWKYTKKALNMYVFCTESDDCGGITHIACAPICAPVCCAGMFADGVRVLKRKHELSTDNEDLQVVFGPSIQRME